MAGDHSPPAAQSLTAPAKLTRSLRIVGRRDDGYHLIEAEMVTLSLTDTVEIRSGAITLEVVDEIAWSGPPVSPRPGRTGTPDNLVLRALALAGRTAVVRLVKAIPAGAGLGGGSADAAAVLRWGGAFDLGQAASLGADVPFCLSGARRAAVSGIGERVEELPPAPHHVLLVVPRLEVSTPLVYRAFDDLGNPRGDFGNDLEPAALAACPELRWWRDLFASAAGERPRLAGSGGTWFLEGDRPALVCLAEQVRAEIVSAREGALVTVVEAG